MHKDEVPIPAPCHAGPRHLRRLPRSETPGWHCALCVKQVIDLSAMTEAEAERLLAERRPSLCVSYAVDAAGHIRFQPTPAAPIVPLSALRRRRAPLVAAGAMALSMAACDSGCGRTMGTPAGEGAIDAQVVAGEVAPVRQSKANAHELERLTGDVAPAPPSSKTSAPSVSEDATKKEQGRHHRGRIRPSARK